MTALGIKQVARIYTTKPATDDCHVVGRLCTALQERFVQEWVRLGNRTAAYRIAYAPSPRTMPEVIRKSASALAQHPAVLKRYNELRVDAELETLASVRELFQIQYDIATADPNEIVSVIARCCRYCHGEDFKYQWINDDEYAMACAKAMDKEENPPEDNGGYGYNGSFEPHPACPACFGVGTAQTVIADTTKLTGKAARLYAGAEQDRWGQVKVKLHDQQKAFELMGRMLGVFNDKLDIRTPGQRENDDRMRDAIPVNMSKEEAQKRYLQMLG